MDCTNYAPTSRSFKAIQSCDVPTLLTCFWAQTNIKKMSANSSMSYFMPSNMSISVDDCVNNKCGNGSTCLDGVGTYSCQCPHGKTGRYCLQNGKGMCQEIKDCEIVLKES